MQIGIVEAFNDWLSILHQKWGCEGTNTDTTCSLLGVLALDVLQVTTKIQYKMESAERPEEF